MSPIIEVSPLSTLVDEPLNIRLAGFLPNQSVTVRSRTLDGAGVLWSAHVTFVTDDRGMVDLNSAAPVAGTYDIVDAMGLIWSMTPEAADQMYMPFAAPDDLAPMNVILDAEIEGSVVASTHVTRHYYRSGVRREVIRQNGLFGTLFIPAGPGPHPAIIVVSGSDGGAKERPAALYASRGYAALALAYFNYETLPKILLDFPLEYFETAIGYLQSRGDIDGERLAVTGRSRGGELSLLLGAMFPQLKVILADVPSGLAWGSVSDNPDDDEKPAWLYQNKPVPYMDAPLDRTIFSYYDDYRQRGEGIPLTPGFLAIMQIDPKVVEKATIPVEKINGAVLLLSGEDDQMWPSTLLSNMTMDRFKAQNFSHPFEHISYPGAGHMYPIPYLPATNISSFHPVANQLFTFGGSARSNQLAAVDSWERKLTFLAKYL